MWIDQHSQRGEEGDLHQPGEAVAEPEQPLFEIVATISHREAADVDRHEAVAEEGFGQPVGEDDDGDSGDEIETFVFQFQFVEKPAAGAADQVAAGDSDGHFGQKDREKCPERHAGSLHNADHEESEEGGHRVVAAGFEFQQRLQLSLEADASGTQNGEYRRRVGR